jgi:hypothetical protein
MTKVNILVFSLLIFGCTKEEIPTPEVITPEKTTPAVTNPPVVQNTPNIVFETVDERLKTTKTGKIDVPVVIINILPDTIVSNKLYLNPSKTLESTQPWDSPFQYEIKRAKEKILAERIIEKNAIEEGTRFRDYGTDKVSKYINIDVVAYINVRDIKLTGAVVDYHDLFGKINLQELVEKNGVKEVWITYFLKDEKPGKPRYYDIPESNMSPRVGAPYGDISNGGGGTTDLPRYNKTYVVYGNNGWRGVDTDLHNRGHQLEMEMMHLDGVNRVWLDNFAIAGRGGNTHWAPNSIKDYDWSNTTPAKSDIITWKPSGGTFVDVNVNTWVSKRYPFEKRISMVVPSRYATGQYDFTNDAPTKWFIYWWQSVPGMDNTINFLQYTINVNQKDIDNSLDGMVMVEYTDAYGNKTIKKYLKSDKYIINDVSPKGTVSIFYYIKVNNKTEIIKGEKVLSTKSEKTATVSNWWDLFYNFDEAAIQNKKLIN